MRCGVKVDVPLGDVVDRVTICAIKVERVKDAEGVAHAQRELDALMSAWANEGLPQLAQLQEYSALEDVNRALWTVEDDLRDCERKGQFSTDFIRLARSVYRLNDRRAALKRSINTRLGSSLVEVKSYTDY
jgi:hypothetical protein